MRIAKSLEGPFENLREEDRAANAVNVVVRILACVTLGPFDSMIRATVWPMVVNGRCEAVAWELSLDDPGNARTHRVSEAVSAYALESARPPALVQAVLVPTKGAFSKLCMGCWSAREDAPGCTTTPDAV